MTKFRITHADASTTDVEAGEYTLKNGFFDFTTYDGNYSQQVMTIREEAVLKIEKAD
jgi:hypothetical protein